MDKIVKVKSKEELIRELDNYKTILNSEKYDYINSLIELEFSALQNYITQDEKNILLNLSVYRDAVIYNIYKRAYDLFSKYDEISKVGNDSNSQNLNAFINGFKIFEFNYNSINNTQNKIIGSILLNNKFIDEDIRDKEIERVINKLDMLKSETNPFSLKSSTLQAYNWNITHKNEIEKYENLLDQYSSFEELTDKDKKNLEIINEVNELLLKDYDISFEKKDEVFSCVKSKMNKEYIKKLPDVSVKNIIRYI